MQIPIAATAARLALAHVPDAELLGRFTADADGPAFTELVRRYGPLVWRVARGVTRHGPAAEDVFQATFLALVRHTAAVRRADALAGWLHRTAYRLALRARRAEAGRLPTLAPDEPHAPDDPLDRMTARELLAAVDEEIQALPAAYRTAVVLCGVQGLSHTEAAARLGWSAGSVKGRLERARARLRVRLEARGLAAPAALLGLVGGTNGSYAVPPRLSEAVLAAVRGGTVSPALDRLAAGAGRSAARPWLAAAAAMVCVAGLGIAFASRPGSDPSAGPPGAGGRPADGSVMWSAPLDTDPDRPTATAGVWAPDGKHVLTAGSATRGKGGPRVGEVRVWDAGTGAVVHTFRGTATGYDTGAPSLAVRPDGKAVAAGGARTGSGSAEFFVEEWGWGEAQPRAKLGPDLDALPPNQPDLNAAPPGGPGLLIGTGNSPSGFVGAVAGLSYSPDGKLLAAASADRCLRVWDRAKGAFVLSHRAERPLRCVAFHPTGAVAVTDDRTGVHFYNPRTGGTANGWSSSGQPPGPPMSVAFSPDGKYVAAAGGVGGHSLLAQVKQISPQPRGYLEIGLTAGMPTAPADLGGVEQVAWSPDGNALALACRDGTVRLIPFGGGALRAAIPADNGRVYAAQFSPDGTRLLTVGRDAVKVWSVADLVKAK